MSNALIPSAPPSYVQELAHDPNLESPLTRRQYKSALDQFYAYRGDREIVGSLVEEYLTIRRTQGAKQATLQLDLAAVKWWARRVSKLARERLTPEVAMLYAQRSEMIQEIKIKSRHQKPAGRNVPDDEIAAVLGSCKADPTPAGKRDLALISIIATTAARNQEIRLLSMRDLNYATRTDPHGHEIPVIEITIKHGKGGHERAIYITGATVTAIESWLAVRGAGTGRIFNPINQDGYIHTDRPLSYEATRLLLIARCAAAGLQTPIPWHDFRRTGAGKLLTITDTGTAKGITGHAQVDTLLKYDRRPDDLKYQAMLGLAIEF